MGEILVLVLLCAGIAIVFFALNYAYWKFNGPRPRKD